MNILMDELPYTVTIAGKQFPINTDYRTGILFEQTLDDPIMPDDEKLYTVLKLYYGNAIFPVLCDIDTVKEALDRIMWFYRCGEDEKAKPDTDNDDLEEREPLFSYEHDAPYIYAAFVEAYQIDLAEHRPHWWKFRALFLGLPETALFCKIMSYRAMEIPAKMPKAQKKFYERMKEIYKLPEPAERIGLKKEMEAILAKGGNISKLIG